MRLETKATHIGQEPDPLTGSIVSPIYQTSTFVFPSVDEGAARFKGERDGYIYTRLGNPTLAALERSVSALENGEKGLAFASGMSAISSVIMAIVSAGDHIVADKCVYGCTFAFLTGILTRFGVEVDLVNCSEPEQVEKAIKPNTKLIYFESPANPVLKMVDMEAMARIGKKHDITTVVDNTFMSPIFQRPLDWGIDAVVHSATKYLGGHGDLIAGIAVGSHEFMEHVAATTLKDLGGVLGPLDAWLILRGIKTLPVRMERHEQNAMKVAEFLENHKGVEKVYYPGLVSHPQHELAKKQMTGFGGMLAFELKGGFEAGRTLMDSVRLCHLAVSLGETGTLIEHPASMTHSPMTPEARSAAGIAEGLVRISVGLEHVDDIISDLSPALKKATGF
ncbi:MAG TPA: aminotransferase class I/II-fold pyridoxal phosphate-dependent enzyme [Firmicutes bacterium]|nr:aminotransferase class I/II-fold pyridoxal phosphate-dependent enzyme [Candidatus Fermentithermobacillaceae bacterium]